MIFYTSVSSKSESKRRTWGRLLFGM